MPPQRRRTPLRSLSTRRISSRFGANTWRAITSPARFANWAAFPRPYRIRKPKTACRSCVSFRAAHFPEPSDTLVLLHSRPGPVAEQPHLVLGEKQRSRLTPARQAGRPARRHPLLVVSAPEIEGRAGRCRPARSPLHQYSWTSSAAADRDADRYAPMKPALPPRVLRPAVQVVIGQTLVHQPGTLIENTRAAGEIHGVDANLLV